jgi:hypothetical protein
MRFCALWAAQITICAASLVQTAPAASAGGVRIALAGFENTLKFSGQRFRHAGENRFSQLRTFFLS